MTFDAGAILPLHQIRGERGTLATQIAALDATLERLGNELAALHRASPDPGRPRSPRYAKAVAERERVAHERAALVVHDTDLLRVGLRAEQRAQQLRERQARLESELAGFSGVPDGLLEALYAAERSFGAQPGGQALHNAQAMRRASVVIQRVAELRDELARITRQRQDLGDDAP